MPVNFSTIRPMDPSTASRRPTFSVENNAPAASAPIGAPTQKSSHWFLKTLAAAAVVVGAAALLRGKVDMFKNFDKAAALQEGAKIKDQIIHYGKKAVAVVGDFVIENGNKAIAWAKSFLPKAAEKAE